LQAGEGFLGGGISAFL